MSFPFKANNYCLFYAFFLVMDDEVSFLLLVFPEELLLDVFLKFCLIIVVRFQETFFSLIGLNMNLNIKHYNKLIILFRNVILN